MRVHPIGGSENALERTPKTVLKTMVYGASAQEQCLWGPQANLRTVANGIGAGLIPSVV